MSTVIPYTENIVTVIPEKCRGCGSCIVICGGEVFEMQVEKSVVARMEQCLECGNCEIACPFNAIQYQVPKGGTGIIYECG
jgi:ferredoxin-like protein FixX